MFELSMWHNACFWNAWFRCQGANWYQRLSTRPAGGSSGVKTTRHHPQTIQRVAASPQPVQGIARRFYRSMFLIGMKQRKLSESLFLIEYITRYHRSSPFAFASELLTEFAMRSLWQDPILIRLPAYPTGTGNMVQPPKLQGAHGLFMNSNSYASYATDLPGVLQHGTTFRTVCNNIPCEADWSWTRGAWRLCNAKTVQAAFPNPKYELILRFCVHFTSCCGF